MKNFARMWNLGQIMLQLTFYYMNGLWKWQNDFYPENKNADKVCLKEYTILIIFC